MTHQKFQPERKQSLVMPIASPESAKPTQPPESTASTLQISRWVAQQLEDRSLRSSPIRAISDDQLPLLVTPLTTRIQAGVLAQTHSALITLACGITDGGLPLEVFIKDPLIDLSMNDRTRFATSTWLPVHLQERSTVLPGSEDSSEEFDCQHHRIITAIQKSLRETNPQIPVFFLGSAASLHTRVANDIDIGTSNGLRRSFSNPGDDVYKNDYDRFASELRKNLSQGKPVIARPTHVGAVWEYMPLALGISVHRHQRALRVTPSEVFVIEAKNR